MSMHHLCVWNCEGTGCGAGELVMNYAKDGCIFYIFEKGEDRFLWHRRGIIDGGDMARLLRRMYEEGVTASRMRIAELEHTLKSHGIPVKTFAGGEAHYCLGGGEIDHKTEEV